MNTGKIGSTTNVPATPSTADVNNVSNSSGQSAVGTPPLDSGKQETPTAQNIAQQTAEATEAKGILDSAAEFMKKTLREAFDSSPNKEAKTKDPALKQPTPVSGSPQPGTKIMETPQPPTKIMENPPGPPIHPSGPLIHPSGPPPLHPYVDSSSLSPNIIAPRHPSQPLEWEKAWKSPEPTTKTLVNDKPAVKLSDDNGK